MTSRVPFLQPDRLVAETLDQAERMRHQQNGLVATPELGELVETLVRKSFIADGKHLVDQQHLWVHVNRYGEPETHIHAR